MLSRRRLMAAAASGGAAASLASTACVAGAAGDGSGVAAETGGVSGSGDGGARPQVRRGYCNGPFGQIHFRTAGRGRPLILCHGAGRTSHAYETLLPRLAAAGFQAVAIDAPGAGLSDPAPHEPSIEELSTSIDAIQAHLGAARVFVVGHHTGGNMASAFAARRPASVAALVISGPEAGFHYTRYAETLPPPADAAGTHVIDLWRKLAAYRNPSTTPEEMTRNFAYELLGRPTSWHLSFATGKFDAAATYLRVRAPTLVVCGRKDGLFAYMDDTQRLRPDFSFVELPGMGLEEVPVMWAEAVLSFIKDKS